MKVSDCIVFVDFVFGYLNNIVCVLIFYINVCLLMFFVYIKSGRMFVAYNTAFVWCSWMLSFFGGLRSWFFLLMYYVNMCLFVLLVMIMFLLLYMVWIVFWCLSSLGLNFVIGLFTRIVYRFRILCLFLFIMNFFFVEWCIYFDIVCMWLGGFFEGFRCFVFLGIGVDSVVDANC